MSDESGDPNTERREAELSALRREVARLLADNESLRAMLVEQQRLLDAMEADLARYRVLWEQSRPHQPERVAGVEQQLVLAGLLQALATPVAAANDAAAAEAPAAPASADSSGSSPTPDPSHKPPTGHGRRPLDITNLPVETIVLDPPEVTAAGGVGYTLVGAEKSDRIAFSPARYIRLRLVQRTFRNDTIGSAERIGADGETPPCASADEPPPPPEAVLVTAPVPDAVWPRVMADPSAIAHAIVSKYEDLLPLHRQEGISQRDGFTLPRSTLCGWLDPAEKALGPIVDAMFHDAKKAPNLAVDATGASVRGPKKGACESWHVFVFIAAKAHVVFRHSRVHDSAALTALLQGYCGYLLADAASIYSPLVTAGQIVLVCCWAHLRRYFFKALESDRTRSLEAIAIIGRLFAVERQCRGLADEQKTARRAELAAPILKLFDDWLDCHRAHVDPRSPLRAAITYADNQREELRRFLEDGRLRIDNNVCEGQLRNLVLGLNNWQRFETANGLRWYTIFRSLIASCKLHELCPQRYLECVLRLAPHWPKRRMLELSPKYWRATAARLTPEQQAIVRPSWSTAFDVFAAASEPAAAPTAA